MLNLDQPPEIAGIWMSVLSRVALANGPVTDMEHRMLHAAAKSLGVGLGSQRVSDEELANSCTDAANAKSLLELALLVALSDKQFSPAVLEELDRIRRVARTDDMLVPLLKPLYAGALRKVTMKVRLRHLKVPFGLAKARGERKAFFAVMASKLLGIGAPYRHELARKYRNLGLLPEGTFGRVVWEAMRLQGLDFPGEPFGLPESAFCHDCSHVLADYDITPLGELLHAWFIAGYGKNDPMGIAFVVVLQYYHGVPIVPVSATLTDLLEPEGIFENYRRGTHCKFDLNDIDRLWQYMNDPIEVAREKIGIRPRKDDAAAFSARTPVKLVREVA